MKCKINRNLDTHGWIDGLTKEEAYMCEDYFTNYIRRRKETNCSTNLTGKAVEFTHSGEWAFTIYCAYERNTIGKSMANMYIAVSNADNEVIKIMNELVEILNKEES